MQPALIVALVLLAWTAWLWHRAVRARDAALAKLRAAEGACATSRIEVARLAAGLSGASDGLIVVDLQGHVVASNPVASELADLGGRVIVGKRLEELVPWPRFQEALLVCRRDGVAQSFEIELHAPVARTLRIQMRALPQLGAVVGLEDQSRLKRLETLRRDFVANVSHELKTPLAAIQGFVETVQDDAEMPPATRQRFLNRVQQQTNRLATLVSDLLMLSRLDDDHGIPSGDPVDLLPVLQSTLADLRPIAEQRQVELQVHLLEGPIWIRSDRETLRQMAGNLIDNAVKYTSVRGRVTVRLLVSPGRVRLEVADTGIGLRAADQARIFERFYRVDQARSRELGGTGLGLSIVKNTALRLGGDVGVKSELGVGSMFWVELPVVG
tara:strand:- start:454 stop:1605 length:1152 start_codon:yes stop_codon:yes gene_type:complete